MAEQNSEEDTITIDSMIEEEDLHQTSEQPSLNLLSASINATSKMVHSPTTDTLDSVILENTATDGIDLKAEDNNEEEIKLDISETEESQKTENTDLSNYFGGMDVKDSDFPVSDQQVPDAQAECNQEKTTQPNDQNSTNISSYFSSDQSSLSSGADFFDTIPTETQLPINNEMTSPDNDEIGTIKERDEIPKQSLVTEILFTEEGGETVEFEGECGNQGEIELPVTEMDDDDNFESFTADHEVVGSPNITTNIDIKQPEMPALPTPAAPTPTQLSPLTTPVHQPVVDPITTYNQGLPFVSERQTSQTLQHQTSGEHSTSAPTSPFHQFQTPPVPSVFDNFGDSNQIEDPFTASLCMSDSDRRHDAWIPSDATRHILITIATSMPGNYTPAVEHLCSPTVLITEPQGDPVRDLVCRYMGEQEAVKRHVLTADSVSRDEKGLATLVEAGCLRAAVDLTGYLLTDAGQGVNDTGKLICHSPKTLQLWFCRFALLMRLRLYEPLDSEMRAFNSMDSPDLYFEFYPQVYPGRRGSMVSFGLRILHAELPHFMGRHQESLDKLYYILAVTSKIVKNLEAGLSEDGAGIELQPESRAVSLKLWSNRETQVQYKIASVLLSMKDYEAAISIFEMLAEKETGNKINLISGIGRIYLQMGNISKATDAFKQVENETTKGGNAAMNSINKGFLAMCVNNFSDAYEHFKSAVNLEPSNTCAVNNMAVCSLYMCRLKDALNTLEALVHKDPGHNLHEGVLFNLCTLYELESSRALHKKQAVLDMVNKHKGDGFPVVCLKMS